MKDSANDRSPNAFVPRVGGAASGAGVGMIVGAAFGNPAIGMVLGAGIGVVLAATLSRK